jgi:integrase
MKGSIGTLQKCPCGEKFSTADAFGLKCPVCTNSRPTRYYVWFPKIGHIYSTPQGHILDSFERAGRLLSAIRTAHDDAGNNPQKQFIPADWKHTQVKGMRMEHKIADLLLEYDQRYNADGRRKLSKGRHQAVHNICDKFLLPAFQGKDVRDITEEEIRAFYFSLVNRGYGDYFIRHILAMLKTLFLRYRGDMPKFPEGWTDPEPKKEKQRLSIDRQMTIAPHIPDRHGYRLAISILQTTGMRPCEIRALQVNDIVDNGLMVWKSKTDRLKLKRKNGGEVYYPLPEYLLQDLKQHIEGKHVDDFIFTINGRPIGEGRLRKVWNKAIEKAQVKHIKFNEACRHSWASREYKEAKEAAIKRISDQLGDLRETAKKHYVIER